MLSMNGWLHYNTLSVRVYLRWWSEYLGGDSRVLLMQQTWFQISKPAVSRIFASHLACIMAVVYMLIICARRN
jgi:hypothetical protein